MQRYSHNTLCNQYMYTYGNNLISILYQSFKNVDIINDSLYMGVYSVQEF